MATACSHGNTRHVYHSFSTRRINDDPALSGSWVIFVYQPREPREQDFLGPLGLG